VSSAAGAYYMCPHDMNNARHAAAVPDHPRTVTIREQHLLAAVTQFLDERIFGPERARLLAELLPATAGADEARRQKQAAKLRRRLQQIDAAEQGHTREMEELATTSGHSQALAAMRRRHLERFTELETEREAINAEIGTRAARRPQETSPELLDALPLIPGILAELPLKLRYKLYQALDLQILYKHDTCQGTFRATITNSTPHTVAAIIHDSHDPASDTAGALRSDSDCVPGAAPTP
jgi:site-specific DNA recombinase